MMLSSRNSIGAWSRLKPLPLIGLGALFAAVGGSAAVSLFVAQTATSQSRAPEPPKSSTTPVVLIVLDTLRADHLGFHGYAVNTSPHLDTLAGDAVWFKRAYATAPWTQPAIGSLFTGQHPASLGIGEEPVKLNERFFTLAELFKREGVLTHGIISHSYISKKLGFGQGFDEFDEEAIVYGRKANNHVSSPQVTDKALEFLDAHRNERFFLFLHYFDPHYNFLMHDIMNTYPDYEGWLLERYSIGEMRKFIGTLKLGESDKRYLNALYDSEVRFSDHHVGRVIARLKEFGLYDDALIVVTADHGEELADRSLWIGHTKKLSTEMIHVPLIIKLPKSRLKGAISSAVSLVDLMPTIADLVNFEIPMDYPIYGSALNLDRKSDRPHAPIAASTLRWAKLQAIVDDEWKLVRNVKRESTQLYHFRADPGELQDVSAEHPEIVDRLNDQRRKWLKRSGEIALRIGATPEVPVFSKEERERLDALGYVD